MSVAQARGTPGMVHSRAQLNGGGLQVNGVFRDQRRIDNFSGNINIGQQHHHHHHHHLYHNCILQGPDRASQSLPTDDAQPHARGSKNLATNRWGVFKAVMPPCEAVWWLCSCCLGYVRSARA